MKKITFFIFSTLSILIALSCNNDTNYKTSKLKEPALGEVLLINNSKVDNLSRKVVIKIDATVEVARRRHSNDPTQCGDCKCGLGVCGVCFFCRPSGNSNETLANLYFDDVDNQYYFELALSAPMVTGVDYTFYVDEDVPVTDDPSYVVIKGNYAVDSTIGTYGGYKIIVKH